MALSPSWEIQDRNGILLFRALNARGKKNVPTEFARISPHFVNACVAVEDERFFAHGGLDFLALARATWQNIRAGKIISGASTITNQLAKLLLQESCESQGQANCRQRTLLKKIREGWLSLKLEREFSKQEIFQMFANRASFSGPVVGVESAAQEFLQKSAKELSLGESALLAGVLQNPSRFSLLKNLPAALKRRSFVLGEMLAGGMISAQQRTQGENEKVEIQSAKMQAPHFATHVLRQVEIGAESAVGNFQFENSGIENSKENLPVEIGIENAVGNLPAASSKEFSRKIRTTLDLGLQKTVERIARQHLGKIQKAHNISNFAILSWESESGAILTWTGSSDFFNAEIDGQVDLILSGRQVGSTLKPFLFLQAFSELGWGPETEIQDWPVNFPTSMGTFWEPQNFDLQFHGPVTVRQALGESLNVPAAKTLAQIGLGNFANFLQGFGLEFADFENQDLGLSAALGAGQVKLLHLARAFGRLNALAVGQNEMFDFCFLENCPGISMKNQQQFSSNFSGKRVATASNARKIVEILADPESRIGAFGENSPLNFDFPVAVKTGTTRNFRDNFAVGFSPNIGLLVWVGNADGSPMVNVSGISGAGPIFQKVMNFLCQEKGCSQSFNFPKFENAEVENVDSPNTFENVAKAGLGKAKVENGLKILRPLAGSRFQVDWSRDLSRQKLKLAANEKCNWFANGEPLAKNRSEIFWQPVERGPVSFRVEQDGESFAVKIVLD